MNKKWLAICFCVFVYIFYEVNAKFCERTEAVTSMVKVAFNTSYITSYRVPCPGSSYGCIKTQWTTSVRRTYVPQRQLKTVKYCCSGYIRTDDSSSDSDIVCEPICMPACKNGHCGAPGECACDPGYSPDPTNSHNCVPSCVKGCNHGACVAPDICRCNFGYKLVNTTCQPVCTDPCHNGTCTAPESCECLPGYRKSEKNLCEPYCSHGCGNGFCAAPEKCKVQDTGRPVPQVKAPPSDIYDDDYSYDDYYGLTEFIKPIKNNETNVNPTKTTTPSDNITSSYETSTVSETLNYSTATSTESNDTTASLKSTSWFHEHWVSIFIPLLVIVSAAVIMLLVWRWAPIIIFFKGRSYVVDGDPVDNGSRPFEEVQISGLNEKDKAVKNNDEDDNTNIAKL